MSLVILISLYDGNESKRALCIVKIWFHNDQCWNKYCYYFVLSAATRFNYKIQCSHLYVDDKQLYVECGINWRIRLQHIIFVCVCIVNC